MTDRPENRVFEFENFRLDAATKILYRDGEQVVLTPKAVETLIALIESKGSVVSKEELMRRIWADTVVEESNLAQYLHVLRKSLGETADGKPYIETLKRRGYRFNGTVRVMPAGATATSEIPAPAGGHSSDVIAASHRFERHGNLRVVVSPAPDAEPNELPAVEPPDNVRSLSERRRETVPDTLPAPPVRRRSTWRRPLLAGVLIIAAATVLLLGVYRFTTSRASRVEVDRIPFRESGITRLTTSGNSIFAAISPDGRYVAHIVENGDGDSLWVRQVAAANDTRIAALPKSDLVWVTFAPDGGFVYCLALERDKGETEMFRVPVLGGPAVKIAIDVGAPEFAPDGTRFAFMRMNQEQSELVVANADGSDQRIVTTRLAPDHLNMFWYAPAWSPDGKSLVFPVSQGDETGRYETVLSIDLDTGAERKLTDTRWRQVGQPRWTRDGIVVAASESSTAPTQLWNISLPDGSATRVTRDLNEYKNLSLTSDGETLAVIQNHVVSDIWTLGNEPGSAKQVRSEAGWLNELIWLPDGRLAYTSSAGGSSDIWTTNSDGSGVRQLTVGANARLGLAVSPDRQKLVFAAEKDGKYNLWQMNIDGSDLTRITNGSGELYPQFTPDGEWIVYQSGGNYPTLWKMPIKGGEAVQLTKTTASRPSISPDGRFVAYHYLDSSFDKSRWGIGISRLDDGTRVKRFDFPPTVVERIVKWSRDGKSIAFLNSPGGIQNIWLQPLDGGEAKPVTSFDSGRIITFNWDESGDRLAVIRGVESSDVVLLKNSSSK